MKTIPKDIKLAVNKAKEAKDLETLYVLGHVAENLGTEAGRQTAVRAAAYAAEVLERIKYEAYQEGVRDSAKQ